MLKDYVSTQAATMCLTPAVRRLSQAEEGGRSAFALLSKLYSYKENGCSALDNRNACLSASAESLDRRTNKCMLSPASYTVILILVLFVR